MNISRKLIKLVEDIEDGYESSKPAGMSGLASRRSGMSASLGMGASGMGAPMDDTLAGFDTDPMSSDIDVEDGDNGATVTVATPKGTSVTVTEAMRRRRALREKKNRQLREGFFKTTGDVRNFYNGDDPNEIVRKRQEANWMNEEDETPDEDVTMSSVSGRDGRRVTGTLTDDNGTAFDIDGTLAFSGDDFEIEDVNLDNISAGGATSDDNSETEEPDATDEETTDGLQKDENAEVTFEERYGRRNEAKSLISKDPIGELLALRSSGKSGRSSSEIGKPHKDPVKKVSNNSLQNRQLDITKMKQGLSDLKDGHYQTKPESE